MKVVICAAEMRQADARESRGKIGNGAFVVRLITTSKVSYVCWKGIARYQVYLGDHYSWKCMFVAVLEGIQVAWTLQSLLIRQQVSLAAVYRSPISGSQQRRN